MSIKTDIDYVSRLVLPSIIIAVILGFFSLIIKINPKKAEQSNTTISAIDYAEERQVADMINRIKPETNPKLKRVK